MSSLKGKYLSSSIILIFFLALCFSFLVLNRWVITEIGLLSYGRVWQLYISYTDFGFVRRGLIGTIFSLTGINSIFLNEYIFAFFIHHVAVALIALLIAYFCIKEKITNSLFLVGVAYSPALIIHSSYTTGALDVFVLVFAIFNILFVRNIFLFSLFLVAGIFTHELFIFTIPAQLWVLYFVFWRKSKINRLSYYTPIVVSSLAIFIIIYFGKTDIDELDFNNIMRMRIPHAFEVHSLWSGYVEVGSQLEHNFNLAKSLSSVLQSYKILFLFLPLLYLVFLTLRVLQYSKSYGEVLLLVAAIFAPLLTSLVATDLHRWVAMSANMALLLTLRLASREGTTLSKWNIPIALFCFMAPLGGAELERPFPLHQFLFEKIKGD